MKNWLIGSPFSCIDYALSRTTKYDQKRPVLATFFRHPGIKNFRESDLENLQKSIFMCSNKLLKQSANFRRI
jgi:hypothetical protein